MREISEMKPLSDKLLLTIKIKNNHNALIRDYGCVGNERNCVLVEAWIGANEVYERKKT
jgi:hypothetical protein